MTFVCVTSGENITLHMNKINVTRDAILVLNEDSSPGPIVREITTDVRSQFLIIHLRTSLVRGQRYHVMMNFTGEVNNDLDGLYYSSFKHDDKDMWVNYTFFLCFLKIVTLWIYYTIPFGFSLFRHFWDKNFHFFKLLCLAKDH